MAKFQHKLSPIASLILVAICLRQASGGELTSRAGTTRAAARVPIRYEVRGKGESAMVFIHGYFSERSVGIIGVDTLHDAEFKWPADQMKELAARVEADFLGVMRGAIRSMFLETANPALVNREVEKAAVVNRKAALALRSSQAGNRNRRTVWVAAQEHDHR